MARRPVVLVTGASGEIGHGLIQEIAERGTFDVLALDVRPLDPDLARRCAAVADRATSSTAICWTGCTPSSRSPSFSIWPRCCRRGRNSSPRRAHAVNVQGTLNLLHLAVEEADALGQPVKFLFPSSIAVYGLPDLATKRAAGKVAEDAWLAPITIYGCAKLHCEHLGRYFARHYRQLASASPSRVDFRAIRFPGLLSAFTAPSGGTSDYAPEMIHAAAQGRPYACFVRPDTRIPFMAMPDAVAALLALMDAPARIADHAGLQRGRLQPRARRAGRAGPQGVPGGADHIRARCTPPGHRRFLAGGRRRRARAPGLGLPPDVRSRAVRSTNTCCPRSSATMRGAERARRQRGRGRGDAACTVRSRSAAAGRARGDPRGRALEGRARASQGPQGARVTVAGREVLNFCANNYLGLADRSRADRARPRTRSRAGASGWPACASSAARRPPQGARGGASPASSAPRTRSSTPRASTPTAACSRRCSASRTRSSPTRSTTPRSSTASGSARPSATATSTPTWPSSSAS